MLTGPAKRAVGAVWTGTLAPQRFVECPFVAANPKTEGQVVWPAYQTYADGERVEWTGPERSQRPASATRLTTAGVGAAGAVAPAGGWVPWAALGVALLGLGLTLRQTGTPLAS